MKRNKILFIIGLSFLLILVLGATYAYFSINVLDNSTDSSIMGTTNKYGTVIMKTETDKLYFNFLGDEMDIEYGKDVNSGIYYATKNLSEKMTRKAVYNLATIKNTDSDISVDCTYKFKITASTSKPINDGSDEDIHFIIDNKMYNLKDILEKGSNGIIYVNSFYGIDNNASREIKIGAFIQNTRVLQQDLVKNKFSINIEPYRENGESAISCKPHYIFKKEETFANNLIKSGKLWQSGLEDDGYRYTFNEYNIGNIGNIVCFGVNSKEECLGTTENMKKYAYLIVGVFSDANGKQHVKLVKAFSDEIEYEKSDLSKNWKDTTIFQTMQNALLSYPETLTNKIVTWNWNSVNMTEDLNFEGISAKEIYNYEMNKPSIISILANREVVTSKIGLMYASDYALSYGDLNKNSLDVDEYFLDNSYYWEHIISPVSSLLSCFTNNCNNDIDVFITKSSNSFAEARLYGRSWLGTYGYTGNYFNPSFYLNSDVKVLGGDGTLNDPYIIN